jgi:hypothetical protein
LLRVQQRHRRHPQRRLRRCADLGDPVLAGQQPQPRDRDCSVPYDDVYFAGVPADDDREGSAEAW